MGGGVTSGNTRTQTRAVGEAPGCYMCVTDGDGEEAKTVTVPESAALCVVFAFLRCPVLVRGNVVAF